MLRLDAGELVADNGRLAVTFDRLTGSIRRLENRLTNQVLLDASAAPGAVPPTTPVAAPWRLEPQGASWHNHLQEPVASGTAETAEPAGCAMTLNGDDARITWSTTEPGITVTVDVRAPAGGDLELWPRVDVAADIDAPLALVYPVLTGLRSLSADGADDRLLFPVNSGLVVRRPLEQAPLRAPYPDGYHGCSVQCSAFFAAGVGGFYLASHDPASTWKWFRFGVDEWSVQHQAFDLRRGASLDLGYPVVLAALTVGDWYEAADHYRAWALPNAPWCRDDTPADRSERRWLHEDVGLGLWGTPSSLDFSAWYRGYAEIAGTALHVTSGWDWPASHPPTVDGRDNWFPARFHEANVAAWEGHRVTPYLNDLFVSNRGEHFLTDWEPHLVYPHQQFPWNTFSQRTGVPTGPAVTTNVDFYLCPATRTQRELHAWRDTELVSVYPLDGVFYDISSGNPLVASRCWRTEHGHPPGQGRHLIEAYDGVNRESKAAAQAATGRYLAQGVETIIENLLGSIDFYVARTGGGPLGGLEALVHGPEDAPGGTREVVPLFDAVYHDVGPLREDGWLTLNAAEGDLFYWLAARITLSWGGLLSLHYSGNPPERLPGTVGPVEFFDWGGGLIRFDDLPALDRGKAAFVSELAAARTALATPFLGHGRMLRPVPFDAGEVELGYDDHRTPWLPRARKRGTWRVPRVSHGAWRAPDGTIGLLFTDVSGDGAELHLDVDTVALWSEQLADRPMWVSTTADGRQSVGAASPDGRLRLDLTLAPRRVTLVTIEAPRTEEPR